MSELGRFFRHRFFVDKRRGVPRFSRGRSLGLLVSGLIAASSCTCADDAAIETGRRAETAAVACPLPKLDTFDFPDNAFLAKVHATFQAFHRARSASRWEEALACAQEAAILMPHEPAAHLYRALSLEALELWHDAHLAYGRALALGADEPEVMRAFADFLVREGSDDALETALLLAHDGRELSRDVTLSGQLALVEARAANALGDSERALSASETALALGAEPEALVERGIALFELTELEQARRALADARAMNPESAKALHWSGLVARQLGDEGEANQYLRRAAALDGEEYPLPLEVSAEEFAALVDRERRALPPELQLRLETQAFLKNEDLPELRDLRDPAGSVLPPTILGLFVPGEPHGKSRIVLYRKNILRVVRDREELRQQVRDTLLHEIGHVAGETDAQLRNRGL